jgi:uncharacterized membrane protein YvlD (DUF360 family)
VVLNILLVVVLPTVIVVAVALLLGRTRTARSGDFDSDSMSFVGGVLSALFTVVLAFYVVFAWQNGDNVSSQSTAEADALVDTYWQTQVEPKADATRISGLVRRYTAEVADREWAMLDRGEADPAAAAILTDLRDAVSALPADTETLNSARDQSLQDLRTITTNHRQRTDAATDSDGFTRFLLISTILGALAMVVYPLLMGLSTRLANIVGLALLTVVLGAIVYVCLQLMYPLHGPFGVSPDAFHDALADMAGTGTG